MIQSLSVYYHQILVGRLFLRNSGRMAFQYDSRWMDCSEGFPISLSLPFQDSPFDERRSRSFFSNLLPEGEVRRSIAARFSISPENDFKLLEAIGGDCAGALSLISEEASIGSGMSYRSFSLQELDESLEALPRKTFMLAEKHVRLSLAGVQQKLPVYREGDSLFIPEGQAASTHILKPRLSTVSESIENEIFCMRLAKRIGMVVPEVDILRTPRHSVFCISRYDRKILGPQKVQKLHQEDFCQALGLSPLQKYQNEGGPHFEAIAEAIEKYTSTPALDKKRFLEWVLFNFIIGNYDAHGKNISLLLSKNKVSLAPFYDLMSTAIYEDLTPKMAMKIGGEYEADKICDRHWERLAETFRVKKTFVLKFVADMKKKTKKAAELLAEDYKSSAVVKKIVAHILKKTGDV
ncbi:MAG: type II toxin-antitoxin system HipA family toxin [Deltaproteobacteria bacterium]|nr:MAG: type II toxin-antitoxin system HipA family toxin [Deltaproteobacteria bacterium]